MKNVLALTLLLGMGTVALAFGDDAPPPKKTTASQDIKSAGSGLKQAVGKTGTATGKAFVKTGGVAKDGAVKTGKAVKSGSKFVVHKSAGAVASGAEKVEDKTK